MVDASVFSSLYLSLYFTMTKASFPHEAHLYPGRHGWDFAAQHTSESLAFHWKAFNGK